MIKKYIIPVIAGIIVMLLLNHVILPFIDMPDILKSMIAVGSSAFVAVFTSNLLIARAGKKKE